MNRLRSLRRSFACAMAGLWTAVCTQRNLRIHLAATCWAFWLGQQLKLDPSQLAVLLLTCAVVVIAELLNTAVEHLTDHLIPTRSENARAAKDTAAGAVLASALFAVCVGVVLLWQPKELWALVQRFVAVPTQLAILAICAALSAWFVFFFGEALLSSKTDKQIKK